MSRQYKEFEFKLNQNCTAPILSCCNKAVCQCQECMNGDVKTIVFISPQLCDSGPRGNEILFRTMMLAYVRVAIAIKGAFPL